VNILVIAPKVPYPPRDGGALATWLPMRGLAKLGHKVSLLAVNTNKHYVSDNQIPSEIRSSINWYSVDTNTNPNAKNALINLFFSRQPYLAERFWTNNFEQKLVSLLSNNEYDIIQCEGPFLLHYLPLIRKQSKAKVIFRAHNVEYEIWERTAAKEKNLLKKIYLKHLSYRIKRFENKLINQYDAIIPITDRDAHQFGKMGNKKPLKVIPAGMEISNTPEPQNFEELKPCFLGALDWIPNQEGLLWFVHEVWSLIHLNYPSIRFHVAGRNAPANFEEKIAVPGIIFHGEVPAADAYLAHFNMLVAPLFSGSGMRVKIIEAMSHGKIVLTTPQGAEGLPCENGKHLLIASTPSEFIALFGKIQTNASLAGSISINARKFVAEHYENGTLCLKLQDFYQSLMSK
jgi:glycosyltransferase involved in cell wall biosynthesis